MKPLPYSFKQITGKNIFERHELLVNSIGAFQEEIDAYEQIKWMVILSYLGLGLLTFIQIISFYLYNGKFHPFSLIVMGEEASKRCLFEEHASQHSDEDNDRNQKEAESTEIITGNYDYDSNPIQDHKREELQESVLDFSFDGMDEITESTDL